MCPISRKDIKGLDIKKNTNNLKLKDELSVKESVEKMLEVLKNKDALASIGEKVIADTIKRSVETRKGIKPDILTTALTFRKGDLIPEAFRGIPWLKVDANGILQDCYTDSWCQSNGGDNGGTWDNWGQCWDNSTCQTQQDFHVRPYKKAIQSTIREFCIEDFSPEERILLNKIGIK